MPTPIAPTPAPSAQVIFATAFYMLVAAGGSIPLLVGGHGELVIVWFGLVSAGGVGHAILGRLGTVSHTLGTQQVTNGDNVVDLLKRMAELEKYSHQKAHDHGNQLLRIEAKVDTLSRNVETALHP